MVRKINEVVSLKKFKPVIEIKGVKEEEKSQLFDEYIITEEVADNFETIFEHMTLSVSEERRRKGEDINPAEINRAFFLRGAYGTGKSYFLLTLGTILERISQGEGYRVKNKFKDFDGIIYHVDKLMVDEKHFVVNINGVSETNIDFEDCIRKNFVSKCKEVFSDDDYIPKSMFEEAVRKLEEDRNNSLRWDLISHHMEEMDLDYSKLVSGLRKHKRESLERYIFLLETAYDRKIDTYDTDFNVFIKESSDYIKDKGYKGIVYMFDEFSAYLTALIEDGKINKNLAKIQELGEACSLSNGNDIVFIASIHKSISILLKSVVLGKQELEKIQERFKEIPISFSEGNELIKNTIKVDKGKYQIMRNKYDEIKELENITYGLLEYYYPMHPVTIDYLNTLSKLYAQENRTLFRFLSDVVDRKIKIEDIMVNGKLNLITMDCLYDYFIEDVSGDDVAFITSANDALRHCTEIWQVKIIKSLVVARMAVYDYRVGSQVKIGLTVDELSKYLLIEDKELIDDFLQNISSKPKVSIFYDKENEVYEFMENVTGKINMEKEKEKIRETIEEYYELKELLKTKGRNKEYYNTKINIQPIVDITPVKREFSSQIYSYSNLIEKLKDKENLEILKDGNIIHLLPQNFEKEKLDINLIEKYMRRYGDNIVIVVPKNYDFNREHIVEYAIYKKMLMDEKYLEDNRIKGYLTKEKMKYEDILVKKINEYTNPNSFCFVFNDGVREFSSFNELSSYMLKKYYYKFPNIEASMKDRTITNQIVRTFVVPGEKVIPSKSNSEENRHIKDTMASIGLASTKDMVAGDIKAELIMPTEDKNPISYEIFDIVCNNEKDKIFEILENAPYGMPEFIIELYIACANSLGKIYIYEDEKNLLLTPEVISNIKRKSNIRIEKPKDSMDIEELLYAKDLWKVLGEKIDSKKHKEFKPEKGSEKKVKIMYNIADDIKLFLNQLNNNIMLFDDKGLNIDLMKKLSLELEKLNKTLKPEEYIKRMNELPTRVVAEKDKNKALKILEDNIDSFMNIIENIVLYSNVLSACDNIHKSRYRFENSKEALKLEREIMELNKKLKEDSLKFKEIDKLYKLVKDFYNLFNTLYKESHDKMHNEIVDIKGVIGSKLEIELIEALEKFQFKGISTLNEIYENIRTKYAYCNNDFSDHLSHDLYHCKCMGKSSTLNDFTLKYEEFMEEVEKAEKTLFGVIDSYRREFIKLDRINLENKKTLRQFIRDKDEKLLTTYMDFMSFLNVNPIENKGFIIKSSKELSNIVKQYKKYIKIGPGPVNRAEIQVEDLNKTIINSIKFTGKSRMDKGEFLGTIKKVLDEEVGDKIIIIRN
ncbi:MAG: hypothetical protein GX987_03880 [Tissierellia bacterium]|nr:hypothetical protein [Tissierellia bacterium]